MAHYPSFKNLILLLSLSVAFISASAAEALHVGLKAPVFQLKSQDGQVIDLAARHGKG